MLARSFICTGLCYNPANILRLHKPNFLKPSKGEQEGNLDPFIIQINK
jgi:hypothetical protein